MSLVRRHVRAPAAAAAGVQSTAWQRPSELRRKRAVLRSGESYFDAHSRASWAIASL